MSVKIVLVLNYIADRQESMIRFGETMRDLLSRHGIRHHAWHPPRLFHMLSPWLPGRFSKWLAYADKFVLGPMSLIWLRLLHRDAIWHIADHSNSVYAFVLPRGRVLVTCHDCIAIEDAMYGRTGQKVGRFGPLLQKWISAGLSRSALVACVSRATESDLLRLVKPVPDEIRVIHNGTVQDLSVPDRDQARALLETRGVDGSRPWMFMIGSDLRRKNRLNVIECLNRLRSDASAPPFQLVLAGKPMEGENRAAADASPWTADIIEIGRLDNETLASAYRNASVVVFPSLAEGFGLPIIEAQACGAALVTSRREPMIEIAGDGAVLVDPEDPSDIALGVLNAYEAGEALRGRGVLNAEKFSPERMFEGYLSAYKKLDGKC